MNYQFIDLKDNVLVRRSKVSGGYIYLHILYKEFKRPGRSHSMDCPYGMDYGFDREKERFCHCFKIETISTCFVPGE